MRRTALALATMTVVAGCGGAASPSTGPVEAALRDRLLPRLLRALGGCADSGVRSAEPVSRCTVSDGDPHILAYYAVLRHGALVTQVEEPALRCARVRGGPGSGARP